MNLPIFDWQEGTASIEWICPAAGLIRFHYADQSDLPYRGVCTVKIEGSEYEFKGMVFRDKGDSPTREEHRSIKGHLRSLGLEGMARRLKGDRVVVKRY